MSSTLIPRTEREGEREGVPTTACMGLIRNASNMGKGPPDMVKSQMKEHL